MGRSKGDCDNEEDEDINPTAVPVLAKHYVAALAETTPKRPPRSSFFEMDGWLVAHIIIIIIACPVTKIGGWMVVVYKRHPTDRTAVCWPLVAGLERRKKSNHK